MAETQKWKEAAGTGTAGSTSSNVRFGEQDLNRDLEQLKADVSRLADSLSGAVQSTVRPYTREFEAQVARNPTMAVMIAAGVGLVLGMLAAR